MANYNSSAPQIEKGNAEAWQRIIQDSTSQQNGNRQQFENISPGQNGEDSTVTQQPVTKDGATQPEPLQRQFQTSTPQQNDNGQQFNNLSPDQSGEDRSFTQQPTTKDGATQSIGQQVPIKNKTEVVMSESPQQIEKNEDAGLAPWLGGISAILILALLFWGYMKKTKGSPASKQEMPRELNYNDRKMLDLACNLVEIDNKT